MKILAIEKELPGIKDYENNSVFKHEAYSVWELYMQGIIREFYFRGDKNEAVLILECANIREAKRHLGKLPLVQNKLIEFDLIPLIPYPGFERLFGNR